MDHPSPRALVALINPDDATRQALQAALEQAGFSTVSPGPQHLHYGQLDVVRFLRDHEPAVVVYDLGPPYTQNWRILQALGDSGVAEERYVILTTVNKAALEQELGPTEALEIGAEASGLHELVRTVRRTFEARAQGTQPQ